MGVSNYKKGDDTFISTNFRSREFDCPCDKCSYTSIASLLVTYLQIMHDRSKLPIRITSGFRCLDYQEDLKKRGYETASGISQHCLGAAADIKIDTFDGLGLERLARASGFHAVGVGKEWIHCDLRSDKMRRWEYKS